MSRSELLRKAEALQQRLTSEAKRKTQLQGLRLTLEEEVESELEKEQLSLYAFITEQTMSNSSMSKSLLIFCNLQSKIKEPAMMSLCFNPVFTIVT